MIFYTPFSSLIQSIKIGTLIAFWLVVVESISFLILNLSLLSLEFTNENIFHLICLFCFFVINYFLIEKIKQGKSYALIIFVSLSLPFTIGMFKNYIVLMLFFIILELVMMSYLFSKESSSFFLNHQDENCDKKVSFFQFVVEFLNLLK